VLPISDVIRDSAAQLVLTRTVGAAVWGFGCRFTPLGLAEEGLVAFCGYLRGLIATRAQEDLAELEHAPLPDFVGALTNVLQDIGTPSAFNDVGDPVVSVSRRTSRSWSTRRCQTSWAHSRTCYRTLVRPLHLTTLVIVGIR
jgi:hypothetical protein